MAIDMAQYVTMAFTACDCQARPTILLALVLPNSFSHRSLLACLHPISYPASVTIAGTQRQVLRAVTSPGILAYDQYDNQMQSLCNEIQSASL